MSQTSADEYNPRFSYTSEIVGDLMTIAGAAQLVEALVVPPDMALRLVNEARERATHYSTSIEGNQLDLDEVRQAIAAGDRTGSDYQQEVRNYWRALEWLEQETERGARISEEFIRKLHRIIIVRRRGRRGEMSEYRTEECPVWDTATSIVDYVPPHPEDVPSLMGTLIAWYDCPAARELPGPLRAAIMAYQLVTIHPFADGNGRTARALATAELWRSGYGMKGFLSVEEHYDADRQRYYDSLQMGLDVEYYQGRNDPDLTPWLTYFMQTLSQAAEPVRDSALQLYEAMPRLSFVWEDLNRRQQQVLSRLVLETPESPEVPTFAAGDIERWFGVSNTTAHTWLESWRAADFIEPASGRQRITSWRLAKSYQRLVAGVRRAMQDRE